MKTVPQAFGLILLLLAAFLPATAHAQVCDGTDVSNLGLTSGFFSHQQFQTAGQSFTAPCDGVLRAVSVDLGTGGTTEADFQVYEGVGIGGSLLSTQSISYTDGVNQFDLPSAVAVTAGQSYTFYFTGVTNGVDGSFSYATTPYPDGDFLDFGITVDPARDMAFALDFEQAPITVTTTADNTVSGDGECTLREAIANANGDTDTSAGDCATGSGTDLIDFAIGGAGVQRITLTAGALPSITAPVVIDGSTQPGATCGTDFTDRVLLIELNGAPLLSGESGLVLAAGSDGSTIRGLSIHSFISGSGIRLNSTGNTVACSHLGLDAAGTTALASIIGINVDASSNTIGGTTDADGNIISANNFGIGLEPAADGTIIQRNRIGTDITGTVDLGNGIGVGSNQGTNTQIGTPGNGNVISGNGTYGIEIAGPNPDTGPFISSFLVQGNIIGLAADGETRLANGTGIFIQKRASQNTIGATDQNVIDGVADQARNVISGNSIYGIRIFDGDGRIRDNFIYGNYIGTNAAGTSGVSNGTGIFLDGAEETLIGSTTPEQRNLISGNGTGIFILGDGADRNRLFGNYIGPDATGNGVISNTNGIRIDGGDSNLMKLNVVTSTGDAGISLENGAQSNSVYANNIGVGADGVTARSNGIGIRVTDSGLNRIGEVELISGDPDSDGNLIGTNVTHGIILEGAAATNNQIGPNTIGGSGLGNGGDGILIRSGANGNRIGGIEDIEGETADFTNTIAFNGGNGITVTNGGTQNELRNNQISDNTGLGIDLGADGVTTNDPGDGDTGPNDLLNYPVLTTVEITGGTTVNIQGTYNGVPDTEFTVEFFASPTLDGSGFGEGATFLRTVTLLTGGGGDAGFNANVDLGVDLTGQFITATAIDPDGNTSEFSAGIQILSAGGFEVVNTNDAGGGSLRQAILNANADTGDLDTITFNIPGPGPHVIQPLTALPFISGPVVIDGTSQPDADCGGDFVGRDLRVVLDGSAAGAGANGLLLESGATGSTVRGLVIHSFLNKGIQIDNSDDHVIACNNIGTDPSGTTALPNVISGIEIAGSATNTTIGGTGTADGNLISGNGNNGINFEPGADNNFVYGNRIGTDITGSLALSNGIGINSNQAAGNTFGGPTLAERNIISGNSGSGILLSGAPGIGNVIEGNYIGLSADGLRDVGNNANGVLIQGSPDTIVRGNVISGNNDGGVALFSAGDGTLIENNTLGSLGDDDTEIGNTTNGVLISRTANTTVLGNTIQFNSTGVFIEFPETTGASVIGNTIRENTQNGVTITFGANGNTIGGTTAQERNIISANGNMGVLIGERDPDEPNDPTQNNFVYGNYIGTDDSGAFDDGNGFAGVWIEQGATGNVVGGTLAGQGNVISGNTDSGVVLTTGAAGNTVENNLIGTDASGTVALGNDRDGVAVTFGASNNTVGDNVLSGNNGNGITIFSDNDVLNNTFAANVIGTDRSGALDLGNGGDGVFVGRASNNLFASNVITNNGRRGVLVDDEATLPASIGIVLDQNRIFGNTFLGIDLGRNGVTPNDDGDGDTDVPNGYTNFPELETIAFNDAGTSATVTGVINTTPNTSVEIGFFASPACYTLGHGDGQFPVGTATYTTDGAGNAAINETLALNPAEGRVITATTTGPDGTSEFSRCIGAPKLVLPRGLVSTGLRDDLNLPQGVAFEGAGNLLVASSGTGEVLYLDASGNPVGPDPLLFGLDSVIDVALVGGDLFVTDGVAGIIYKVSLADAVTNGPLDVGTLTPWASGLNGPAHLHVGPDGLLYVSLVNGTINERIIRVDPAEAIDPAITDVITFDDAVNLNPSGMAFDSNGDLYVSSQFGGQVLRATATQLAGGLPIPDASLATVFDNLNSPNGLAFNSAGRLFVATPTAILSGETNAVVATPYVTGLSGYAYNQLLFDKQRLFISDGAGRRLTKVTAPQDQKQGFDELTYVISQNGSPNIDDGSDLTAIQNAFTTWESIPTADISFIFGGTTPQTQADALDGINLVTFEDDLDLDDFVLAVVAKTIEYDDDDQATIIDADLIFNKKHVDDSNFRFGTDTVPETYDIESIAAHEIGHLVGLRHGGDTEGTMFFALPLGTDARTLEQDDVAKVSALYPSATFDAVYGTITGNIEDGSDNIGEPIAGALVTAFDELNDRNQVSAFTDIDGNYRIAGLLPGTYKVFVQPLDGDVYGFPLRPSNISAYLESVANNTRFIEEFYTLGDDSDPLVDDPADFTLVTVTAGATQSGINVITNQDIIPPAVEAITPADGATDIARKANLLIRFSEEINPATFDFELNDGTGPVAGTLQLLADNDSQPVVWTFRPNDLLNSGATYTVTIGGGLEDVRGNALGADFTSTFSTVPPDVQPPAVTQVAPRNGATEVFTNTPVTVTFSEQMDAATLPGNLTLTGPSGDVPGEAALSQSGTFAVFTPASRLDEGASYTVTVGTGFTDLEGNGLTTPFIASFTTVSVEPPTVMFFGPRDGDADVTVNTGLYADFSEPIEPTTVTTGSFSVVDASGTPVPGSFEFVQDDSRVVFDPSGSLNFSTTYTLTITTDITDASSPPQPLAEGVTASFTTAAAITSPVITSVTPLSAVRRKIVVITGNGFSANPQDNIVSFNGARAAVSAASLEVLTVTIPDDATAGPLTVTVNGLTSNEVFFDVITEVPVLEDVVKRTGTGSEPEDVDIGPDGTFAYVTNSGGNTVTVINVKELELVTDVPVGTNPLKLVVSPDGSRVYVTNFIDHTVSVIDTETNAVVETIPVGLNPIGIAITPDGARVYVAESTGKGFSIIDANPKSGTYNRVVKRTGTGSENEDAEIGPDGTFLYLTGNDGLAIIDINPKSPDLDKVVKRTGTGSDTDDVEIGPDGTFAFVTTADGELLVIDINPFSSTPYEVVKRTGTGSDIDETEIGPDGTIVYAISHTNGTVIVFRFSTGVGGTTEDSNVIARNNGYSEEPVTGLQYDLTIIKNIEVGTDPSAIVFSPSENIALVTNTGDDEVAKLSFEGGGVDTCDGTNVTMVDNFGFEWCWNGVIVDTGATGPDDLVCSGEGVDMVGSIVGAYSEASSAAAVCRDERLFEAEAINEAPDACSELSDSFIYDGTREGNLAYAGTWTSFCNGEELSTGEWNGTFDQSVRAPQVQRRAAVPMLGRRALRRALRGTERAERLDENNEAAPVEFALEANSPNPFNPTTIIRYALPESADVHLVVYDVLGREVMTLVDGAQRAGYHQATFDASGLPSGMYLYRLQAGTFVQARTMILVK